MARNFLFFLLQDFLAEFDQYTLAKSYFDLKEYDRAAYFVDKCRSQKAFFLHVYARYLVRLISSRNNDFILCSWSFVQNKFKLFCKINNSEVLLQWKCKFDCPFVTILLKEQQHLIVSSEFSGFTTAQPRGPIHGGLFAWVKSCHGTTLLTTELRSRHWTHLVVYQNIGPY